MTSPALAQTSDEILADGRAEAVLVISETAFTIAGFIIGALVALVGVVVFTALRLIHNSTPPMVHEGLINLADKALTALQDFAKTTPNTLDDRLVEGARGAFDKFLNLIFEKPEDETGDEDEQPLPVEPEAKE